MLIPVLIYGSETVIWKEKERYRLRTVQIDNLRGLLGIRRMDKVPCTDKEVVESGERIDEGVVQWFSHLEVVEIDRIAKMTYVGECGFSHSVGRLWKGWVDIVKDCLKKRGLDVRQASRMVHDRTE